MSDPQAANWLARRPSWVVAGAAAMAAFAAYTCMYAFRRPFTAPTYDGLTVAGADYKSVAVAAQFIGYMTSKFIGIKIVSEVTAARRAGLILAFIGIAAVGLLGFALLPRPWNIAGLVLNGLPLGMIWGLVFGFLEGRRVTEVLGLGLSLSVIFASGWVKSAGAWVMEAWGVSAFWMPLVTGGLFTPLLLLAVAVLAALPAPDEADRAARTTRQPMDRPARREFLREWRLGVILLTGAYLCLMIYRDVRDTFMADVLKELGQPVDKGVFARVENAVGLIVTVSLGWLVFVRDNRRALLANFVLVVLGPVLAAFGTWLFQRHVIGPVTWLILTGAGVYLAFVPFQSFLFDRLLAMLRHAGTAAFLMAIADSFGYLSTVGVYLSRFIRQIRIPWSQFLMEGSYVLAALVAIFATGAAVVFFRRTASAGRTVESARS